MSSGLCRGPGEQASARRCPGFWMPAGDSFSGSILPSRRATRREETFLLGRDNSWGKDLPARRVTRRAIVYDSWSRGFLAWRIIR